MVATAGVTLNVPAITVQNAVSLILRRQMPEGRDEHPDDKLIPLLGCQKPGSCADGLPIPVRVPLQDFCRDLTTVPETVNPDPNPFLEDPATVPVGNVGLDDSATT